MTRDEILSHYDIDANGTIRSPGKFEAEPIYAPRFYQFASDGEELSFFEDGSGEYVSLVPIEPDDRDVFPELGTARYVLVTESDQGFVGVSLVATEKAADRIRLDYEPEEEEEDC